MTIKISYITKGNQLGETVCRITMQNSLSAGFEEQIAHILPEESLSFPVSCRDISEEEALELFRADENWKAVISGLYSLQYGACSSKGLQTKLRKKGFSASAAESAVGYLSAKGYIKESEEIRRLIEIGVSQNRSAKYILSKLYQKGYSDESVREAKALMEEIDFGENCYRTWLSKIGNTVPSKEDLAKTFAKMARMGFTFSQIQDCVERIQSNQTTEI